MSAETLLIILLVGLIAGWLAGQVVKGTGFGLVADIAIGIVGALIGSWLLPRLGIHLGSGRNRPCAACAIPNPSLLSLVLFSRDGSMPQTQGSGKQRQAPASKYVRVL